MFTEDPRQRLYFVVMRVGRTEKESLNTNQATEIMRSKLEKLPICLTPAQGNVLLVLMQQGKGY